MKYKTILVDIDTYNMLKELKEKKKVSFNELIKEIVREYIRMKKREAAKKLLELLEKDVKWDLKEYFKMKRKQKELDIERLIKLWKS